MNRKESIIKLYKELVIKKQGARVTVKEICQEMGISRTTFYKYFKDAYDIMEYILVNDAINQMKILCAEKLESRTILESWYICFYENKDFYYYAMKDESQNSLFNTLIQRLTEFNINLYEGYLDKEDIEYYAYKYASLQTMFLKKWINDGMKVEPRKMVEYFTTDLIKWTLVKKCSFFICIKAKWKIVAVK